VDVTEQIITAFIDHWALIVGIVLVIAWVAKTFFPGILDSQKAANKTDEILPASVIVKLDPATAEALREIGEVLKNIAAVTLRTDSDGVPLVYADRKQEASIVRLAEVVKEIADAQRHLAESMARLDARFAEHDRADSIIFSRMADAQTRLEAIGNSNRDAMLIFAKDHQQALKALDEIKAFQIDHDNRVMKAVSLQEEILKKTGK
jgi:hypothetical protein